MPESGPMSDHDFEELEIKLVRTASGLSDRRTSPRASPPRASTTVEETSNRRDLIAQSEESTKTAWILETGAYEVLARSSCGGSVREPLSLTLSEEDLDDLLCRGPALEAEKIERLGHGLFNSVFQNQVLTLFHLTDDHANREGKRLRFRFRVEPPELARIPWEIVRPEMWASSAALLERKTLFREEEQIRGFGTLRVTGALRLLLVSSSPTDHRSLDVDSELRLIESELRPLQEARKVEIRSLPRAGKSRLEQELRDFRPHVVHFMMHGDFDARGRHGLLMLEADDGTGIPIEAEELATYFDAVPKSETRLVIFNACRSAVDGDGSSGRGVAASLARLNVPAIIAMQYSISDRVAIVFARELYRRLIGGHPIEVAVAWARHAIRFGIEGPLRLEWLIPVLYLRASDTQLFEGLSLEKPLEFTPDAAHIKQITKQVESAPVREPAPRADDRCGAILELTRTGAACFRLRLTTEGTTTEAKHGLPFEFLQQFSAAARFQDWNFLDRLMQQTTDLFNQLFPPELAGRLREVRCRARDRDFPLTILGNDPLLDSAPWEYARDPATGLFLSTGGRRFPMIRQLFDLGERAPAAIEKPLRILVLTCNPVDLPELQLEREREWIREGLGNAPAGSVEVDFLINPTAGRLDEQLNKHAYHILHFAGYDSFALMMAASTDPKPDWFERVNLDELLDVRGNFRLEEGLVLLDAHGRMKCLYAADLCDLLAPFDSIRLVVTNTCYTAAQLAPMLVRAGVPAAIGMRYGLNDDVAVRLALAFYKSLLRNRLDLAAALAEARRALKIVMTERNYRGHWGFPSLYTSVRDAKVFGDVSSIFGGLPPVQKGEAARTGNSPRKSAKQTTPE